VTAGREAPDVAPGVIVALLIGELAYQRRLNAITCRIVEHAIAMWRRHPSAILVCEAEPMRWLAEQAGVPSTRLLTALPQPKGHTTRLLAEWLRDNRPRLPGRPWWIVTHDLHASRATRLLARCGLDIRAVGVSAPFDSSDADWKLRSARRFRVYNLAAGLYCRSRGWL